MVLMDLLEGFSMMFTFKAMATIMLGVTAGVIVGAIPGLSVTMGMAILVPVTYYMPPELGIPFLVGVTKGGVFGGSIPSILISAPGAGGSVATMLDGYPLAKKGRAKAAIQMAVAASFVGDVFGTLITIFLAASIANLAMLVGRPEMFAILACSIVMVASAAGGDPLKGLMAAAFGLMLSTVGTDVGGRWRFAFGNPNLASGFDFVPMIIGLYAFAVVIEKIIEGKKGAEEEEKMLKGKAQLAKTDRLHWSEFRPTISTQIRSAIIGTVIGAIPALGQPIAAMLGYSTAKKLSKQPEKFGTGCFEGIAAPEAANNAVNSPAYLPLFAFGIPGDSSSAVLLGAFMVHGMRPGPSLFRDYGNIMYGIFAGALIACIFMLILGFFVSGVFAKIAMIPSKILMPFVFSISVVGAYSVNNNIYDVALMIIFGLVGCLMRKYDIPMAPLAITFLLGHSLEMNLIQSMILFQGNILRITTKPFAFYLILFTILMPIIPRVVLIYRRYKNKSKNASEADAS